MKQGDFIRINYVGKLETGEVFDLTDPEVAKKEKVFDPKLKYRPIPVIIGESFVLPGLEKVLMDMKVGDKKKVDLKPEEGFGKRNPEMIRVMPEKSFNNASIKPGMIVDFGQMKGRIQSVDAGRVRVDFNHPLAGKVLKYEVEVVDEVKGRDEKIKAVLEFFGIEQNFLINDKDLEIEIKNVPPQVKERMSDLILKHVKEITKIKFIEIYVKKADVKEKIRKA